MKTEYNDFAYASIVSLYKLRPCAVICPSAEHILCLKKYIHISRTVIIPFFSAFL